MRKTNYFFANMPRVSFAVACVFCILVFVISSCDASDVIAEDNNSEALATMNVRAAGSHPYYFFTGEGNKVYLSLNTNYAFLSVREPRLPDEFAQRGISISAAEFQIERRTDRGRFQSESRFHTKLKFEETLTDEQYLKLLSDLRRENEGVIISPFFKSEYGERMGLSNLFYVKLKTESDITLLQQVAEQYNLIIIEQDPFMPLWFVLSTTEASEYNTLELYHLFIRKRLFQAALPDFMVNALACVSDPFFYRQWGLRNIGQSGGTSGIDIRACAAWQRSTGTNVTVAIIDQGIAWSHPDLQGNIHPSAFDADTRIGPVPLAQLTPRGNHGTPVAGIVGAMQNGEGISGVAPNSRLMSIASSFSGDITIGRIMNIAWGINQAWQHGADVINLSWGSNAFDVVDPHTGINPIRNAIHLAVTQGRDGLGCVIVAATQNFYGAVVFPASMPEVIGVGAIDRNGRRPSFSNFGTGLDVVAPGAANSILTTHWHGGYRYYGHTSIATPHVAGIAALILSVRPDLTQAQVRNVITSTARRLPHYPPSSGTWNNQVGHGLVDAYEAVMAVLGLPAISGPAHVGSANAVFVIQRFLPGATVTWSQSANLQQVSASGNTATFRAVAGTAPGYGWIGATVNNVPLSRYTVNVTVPPPVISGPALVCVWEIFTMESNFSPGANVTWTHSSNLEHIGNGTFRVLNSTPQRGWVRVAANNASSIHDFWVGPPVIDRIYGRYGWVCNMMRYEAEFLLPWLQMATISCISWSLSGSGARFVSDTDREVVYVEFSSRGVFTLTVTATNDCGSAERRMLISSPSGVRESTTTHTPSKPISISGAFQLLLAHDANARRQNTYDVRVYDNSGNMVRQIVTESGSVEFDVSSLPDGNYYLHICNGVDEPMIQPVVVENRR